MVAVRGIGINALPASWQPGDALVLVFAGAMWNEFVSDNTKGATMGGGWTSLQEVRLPIAQDNLSVQSNSHEFHLYTKVFFKEAVAGETNPVVTISPSGSSVDIFYRQEYHIYSLYDNKPLLVQESTAYSLIGRKATWRFLRDAHTIDSVPTKDSWEVPAGVSSVAVDIAGHQGGATTLLPQFAGGRGGRVTCDLAVSPGDILYIYGSQPHEYDRMGFDIRLNGTSLADRVVVAGSGGQHGAAPTSIPNVFVGPPGGDGGGLVGQPGGTVETTGLWGSGGAGGTQSAGGSGGAGYERSSYPYLSYTTVVAQSGTAELGGDTLGTGLTSSPGPSGYGQIYGGRGGGGWYGGGAGGDGVWLSGVGNDSMSGGGGGGSSWTHPTLCSNVAHTQGYQSGLGYAIVDGGTASASFVGPGPEKRRTVFEVSGGRTYSSIYVEPSITPNLEDIDYFTLPDIFYSSLKVFVRMGFVAENNTTRSIATTTQGRSYISVSFSPLGGGWVVGSIVG